MPTQLEKAERFRALHAREEPFVIPNPWDIGSARLLTALGFEALATTSSGMANALGRVDGEVSLPELVEHCRALSEASPLPLSADIENGFAEEPDRAAENVLAVARAGAVGGSIEDFSGDEARPIYDFDLAVERVAAASEAVRSLDFPFTLTARAENLLHRRDDLDDTIRRLQAFERAGAEVVYAPGLRTLQQVREVAGSVTKPLNVLAPPVKGATLAELGDAGARRISIGGALARAAIGALLRAGREMRERGTFSWTAELASTSEVDDLLDRSRR